MFIQGIIDRLVKDSGLVLRGLVVYRVPGVSGTVGSGGLAGFRGRGCRGKRSYRVGGVILEPDRRRAGGGIRRCCLNSPGGEVEALLRRGSRCDDQGVSAGRPTPSR